MTNRYAELTHGTLTDVLAHLETTELDLAELQAALVNVARQLRDLQAARRADELRQCHNDRGEPR